MTTTHAGVLKIGGTEIPCYNLPNGKRVVSAGGAYSAFGVSFRGVKASDGDDQVAEAPTFLVSAQVSPFVSEDLSIQMKEPIRFFAPTGGVMAYGYDGTMLIDAATAVLAARDAGALWKDQARRLRSHR